jgi:hypothetical protein
MKVILYLVVLFVSTAWASDQNAYQFLKKKSLANRPVHQFNEYEDIASGALAFLIGNVGYFTTDSSTLKIAYSGVQTVGIVAVGHGIYDFYYPHFETRLLGMLNQKKMTKGELANGYVKLLGEMDRARRLSILWSSSLLTLQYGLNAFVGNDIPSDMKDIYLFLGGVNAIVAVYSYLNFSDYEKFYHEQNRPQVGFMIVPSGTGISLSKTF